MRTQISHDSKGFRASVTWDDKVQINSNHFDEKWKADAWLAQTVATQRNCVFSEKRAVAERARKMAAAALAIALILPLAMPALAHRGSGRFIPPDNGGPTTSQPTGSR